MRSYYEMQLDYGDRLPTALPTNLMFLLGFMFLAMDTRASVQGGSVFSVLVPLLALAMFTLHLCVVQKIRLFTMPIVLATALFVLVSIVAGLAFGQSLASLLRAALPYIFFVFGVVLVSNIPLCTRSAQRFVHGVTLVTLFSVIFKAAFTTQVQELSIETARYKIISMALILLFSIAFADLILRKRIFPIFSLSLCTFIIFVSTTRTYILVMAGMLLFYSHAYGWGRLLSQIKRIPVFFLVLTLVCSLPFVNVDLWYLRLISGIESHGGVDVTLITRLAEITYQLDVLLADWRKLLFGAGLAAQTYFSSDFSEALSIVFSNDYEYQGVGGGHNTYVGIIFTGGVLAGSLFIITVASMVFQRLRKLIGSDQELQNNIGYFLITSGGASVVGYSIYGLFGGLFGDRLGAFCFGCSIGFILIGARFMDDQLSRRH